MNPLTGLPEFQEEYDPNIDIGFGPGQFTPDYGAEDVQGMAPEQFERFTGEQPMFVGGGSSANIQGLLTVFGYDMPDVAQDLEMAYADAAQPSSAVGGRQVEPVDENILGVQNAVCKECVAP